MRVARTVAADPDVADMVDEDTVVGGGPIVAFPRPAPGPDEIAVGVEGEHRRCSGTAFAILQFQRLFVVGQCGGAAMDDPDHVLFVDPDAYGLPKHPVVGQRPGPKRVDFEPRRLYARLLRGGLLEHRFRESESDEQREERRADEESAFPLHAGLPW